MNKDRKMKKFKQNKKLKQMTEEDEILEKAVLGRDETLLEHLLETTPVETKQKKKKRVAAWTDDDDDDNNALLDVTPNWADLNKKDDRTQEELLEETRAANFLNHELSDLLPKGILRYKHCADINQENQHEGRLLKTVEFHPKASVAVLSGMTGIASLHQIDGKTNPRIQSVTFNRFPICTSHFNADGEELIVGSNVAGFFYYYNMITGKIIRVPWNKAMEQKNMEKFEVSPDGKLLAFHGRFGYIHLIAAKTKEWIGSLKMNGRVSNIAFNKEGDRLYSHGDLGEVYIWDLNTRDCIHRFHDDGCVSGTSVSISPNGQYLACGSDSGVVNIYDTSSLLLSTTPKPMKILLQLTTSVNKMKFNHSSEFLVMTSDQKDSSIRLVHCSSMEAFKNFPKTNYNIRLPLSFDISLNSGFLAISNNTGKAFLYRLNHYGSY